MAKKEICKEDSTESLIESLHATRRRCSLIVNPDYLDDENLPEEERTAVLKEIFNRNIREKQLSRIVSHLTPVLDGYPDFYLPEFKTYIEYYGLAGDPDYERGIKKKELSYQKSEMDVISLYPRTFREDWRGYIMQELESNILRRYHNLMAKPYWSKNKPSLNSQRSEYGYRPPTIRLY